jgi:hypothetical protein
MLLHSELSFISQRVPGRAHEALARGEKPHADAPMLSGARMSPVPEIHIADPSLVNGADVARSLGSDPASGLASTEAADGHARVGPNRLDPAAEVRHAKQACGCIGAEIP